MKYRLIVITHGGDETTPMLRNTLASFEEMVYPKPAQRILIEDGPRKEGIEWRGTRYWTEEPEGFCSAARRGWEIAGLPGVSWVYWLEHDFMHTRPVRLMDLGEVLASNPAVAQMSLMRQAVNVEEVRAGGVVARDPDSFAPKRSHGRGTDRSEPLRWLEHGRYWTTNPSLFRQKLAEEIDWPSTGRECEGHHTIQLREQGYSFGIWGRGEPWVTHIGERSGFGY